MAKAHAKDASDDKRERIDAILSKIVQSDHSFFFAQLRSEAREEGSFDKVKGLIESMIARLEKQAAEEAEATSLRSKEHEEFLKASKDYKDSADAVANAIS